MPYIYAYRMLQLIFHTVRVSPWCIAKMMTGARGCGIEAICVPS